MMADQVMDGGLDWLAADLQLVCSYHRLVRIRACVRLLAGKKLCIHGKAVLQVINYAGRPGADPVSVRVAGPYREARIHLLENDTPKPLPSVPSNAGAIELHLPAIPVYAAIELI